MELKDQLQNRIADLLDRRNILEKKIHAQESSLATDRADYNQTVRALESTRSDLRDLRRS